MDNRGGIFPLFKGGRTVPFVQILLGRGSKDLQACQGSLALLLPRFGPSASPLKLWRGDYNHSRPLSD